MGSFFDFIEAVSGVTSRFCIVSELDIRHSQKVSSIIRPYLRTNYQQKPTLYRSSRPKNVLPEGSSDNRLTKWVPYNEMAHMLRHAAHVYQTQNAVLCDHYSWLYTRHSHSVERKMAHMCCVTEHVFQTLRCKITGHCTCMNAKWHICSGILEHVCQTLLLIGCEIIL